MTSAAFPIFEAIGCKKPVAVCDRDVHLVGEELLDQLLFHASMIALTISLGKRLEDTLKKHSLHSPTGLSAKSLN